MRPSLTPCSVSGLSAGNSGSGRPPNAKVYGVASHIGSGAFAQPTVNTIENVIKKTLFNMQFVYGSFPF